MLVSNGRGGRLLTFPSVIDVSLFPGEPFVLGSRN